MQRLLLIHTSLNGSNSLSSSLAKEAAERWQQQHPEGVIDELDFVKEPIPHLTADVFGAFNTPVDERSEAQHKQVELSDRLIGQLKAADEIVLAVPMYNFGVPSMLRAYFDHIARAGITFRYTSDGPVGLLNAKRATIVATRGGRYQGTALDTPTAYLKTFLAFVGINKVDMVYAEGLAKGEDGVNLAIESARQAIDSLHSA